jgi:hypothetical protein
MTTTRHPVSAQVVERQTTTGTAATSAARFATACASTAAVSTGTLLSMGSETSWGGSNSSNICLIREYVLWLSQSDIDGMGGAIGCTAVLGGDTKVYGAQFSPDTASLYRVPESDYTVTGGSPTAKWYTSTALAGYSVLANYPGVDGEPFGDYPVTFDSNGFAVWVLVLDNIATGTGVFEGATRQRLPDEDFFPTNYVATVDVTTPVIPPIPPILPKTDLEFWFSDRFFTYHYDHGTLSYSDAIGDWDDSMFGATLSDGRVVVLNYNGGARGRLYTNSDLSDGGTDWGAPDGSFGSFISVMDGDEWFLDTVDNTTSGIVFDPTLNCLWEVVGCQRGSGSVFPDDFRTLAKWSLTGQLLGTYGVLDDGVNTGDDRWVYFRSGYIGVGLDNVGRKIWAVSAGSSNANFSLYEYDIANDAVRGYIAAFQQFPGIATTLPPEATGVHIGVYGAKNLDFNPATGRIIVARGDFWGNSDVVHQSDPGSGVYLVEYDVSDLNNTDDMDSDRPWYTRIAATYQVADEDSSIGPYPSLFSFYSAFAVLPSGAGAIFPADGFARDVISDLAVAEAGGVDPNTTIGGSIWYIDFTTGLVSPIPLPWDGYYNGRFGGDFSDMWFGSASRLAALRLLQRNDDYGILHEASNSIRLNTRDQRNSPTSQQASARVIKNNPLGYT